MTHDEICAYELCKLAEEKGFNVPTSTIKVEKIEGTEKEVWDEEECRYITQWEIRSLRIPTQSLLQRWLREEESIDIAIYPIFINGVRVYTAWIYAPNLNKPKKFNYYDTYELALEDALKYALENLV